MIRFPTLLLVTCLLLSSESDAMADPAAEAPADPSALLYDNTLAKDFILDAPWRVVDRNTPIPITVILKDCDVDDIRDLHWIRAWDVTNGSTLLWDHDFNDETIGNNASEHNYWTYITTVTEGHPVLPDDVLLTPANLGYGTGDEIDLLVSVYYRDDIFNYTDSRTLRVHVGSGRFPWPDAWYGGDTHYHSMYTNNLYEFGAPIPAVQLAGIAMGLQWLTVTDHSCDLDETGDGLVSYATQEWEYTIQSQSGIQTWIRSVTSAGSSWASIQSDIDHISDERFRIYRGVEINLASIDTDSYDKTLHGLFYNPHYISSPDCGVIGERPVRPQLPAGLGALSDGGFAYASHPISDLGLELGGQDFGVNGAKWGDQDIESALSYEAFRGFELFNTRITLHADDQNDPWSEFDAGESPESPYPAELVEGVALWDDSLRGGLENDPDLPPRKIFISGGSDAHGDFNYSTHLDIDNYADDNAMGKVQTVVHVPGGYGPDQLPPTNLIMDAFRAGRSIVTDGPFLEIGFDLDGDGGWYGEGDLSIGSDGSLVPTTAPELDMIWRSLPEFGEVSLVRVFVGTAASTNLVASFVPANGAEFDGLATVDLGPHDLDGPTYVRAELRTSDGGSGHRAYTNPIWIYWDESSDVSTGVTSSPGLVSVRPNPFEASMELRLDLEGPGHVTLDLVDARGRTVRHLLEREAMSSGRHLLVWDGLDDRGRRAPSGAYFYVLRYRGVLHTGRITRLR